MYLRRKDDENRKNWQRKLKSLGGGRWNVEKYLFVRSRYPNRFSIFASLYRYSFILVSALHVTRWIMHVAKMEGNRRDVKLHAKRDKIRICECENANFFEISIEIRYFEVRFRDPTRLRASRGCLATLCRYQARRNWEQGGHREPRSRTKQRIYEMERKIRAILRNGAGSKETLKLRWTIRSCQRTNSPELQFIPFIYIPMYTYNSYLLYVPIAPHCSRILLSWYLIPFLYAILQKIELHA